MRELQERGQTIAFVGDGINDSAALAHASVSVSFAGATDMACDTQMSCSWTTICPA